MLSISLILEGGNAEVVSLKYLNGWRISLKKVQYLRQVIVLIR